MTRVVLLAGATGWVGRQLLPLLARQPYGVRCLEVWPEKLQGRVPEEVELVPGDLHDAASLAVALAGVETALYLVHAQSASGEDTAADRGAAETFGAAARAAGVRRLVYFGGFGPQPAGGPGGRGDASAALRASGVPVIELRASVILGAGGLCFEMLRALVERLPVLVAPRWMRAPVRPIFIDDVLASLLEAVQLPVDSHRTFVLGGPEAVSYGGLMREYARLRGLRRWIVPVPGDAAWLGTYGDWRTARNAFDVGQADLARLGFNRLGKEWILPVVSNKVTKQAAIIADLETAAALKLCSDYQARKLFCQVKKPEEIVAPFSVFWR